MKKAIIFDLDGTLWDSSENVTKSWNVVLSRHSHLNRQITADDMHSYMGKTMHDIARMMLPDAPDEEIRRVMDECCAYENEYLASRGGILYPRLEETLAELSRAYGLYIVSNCQEGYIEVFMKYHGLEKYFSDFESYGRTGKLKADNIAILMERRGIGRAVYVGDTALDMQSAREAGIPFIHAAYGFGEADAEISINSLPELPAAAEKIFSGFAD